MSPGHPLSFAQQRLWFLDQLSPGLAHYNCPVVFDIEGPVDLDVFRRALEEIVRRHEPLRTVFVADGGVPQQRVLPPGRFDLPFIDLSHLPAADRASTLDDVIAREVRRPFDLASGPIFRATVVHFSATDHVLIGVIHHIAFDGWSGGIILRELAALYDAFSNHRPSPLAALPLTYTQFAAQQRAWASTPAFERQMAYWREQLRSPRAILTLPADRPRIAAQSHRGHRAETYVSDAAVQSLEQIGRAEGATPFMVLLAVYAALLHRLSGQEDILIGTGIANRNRQELEPMVGFFVNSLVIRLDLSNQPSFRAVLRQARRIAIDAYANQDVPFERMVEELNPERSLGQMPIAQAFLVTDNAYGAGRVTAAGNVLLRRRVVATGTAKFDAMLSVWRHPVGRRVVFDTNADLFSPESGEGMLHDFCYLVEHLSAHADDRLDRMPLASAAQRRQQALDWNRTVAPAQADRTLVDLFEAQVQQRPDADAVRCGDGCVSYAALDRRASRLAADLRRRGVTIDDRVGVCLQRSPDLIVAVLAVLKAGAAYVPLDPLYPLERLRFIAADAGCRVILTEPSLKAFSAALGVGEVVPIDDDIEGDALPCPAVPTSLAYVIYTSGSTGTPKGVAVEHRQVVNLIAWALTAFTENERAGMLASTSMSFDLSVFEWFVPLCSGGTVILVENLLTLPDAPARDRVTFINSVPSVVREFIRGAEFPPNVAVVAMAGEPLSSSLVADVYRRRPDVKVFDLYGPTETTVYATCALRDTVGAPTIGRPIANTVVLVLDEQGQVVPAGLAGEMFIGGAGVARGYLGREDLTRERFVDDPSIDLPSGRMYRTGDRARWRRDGSLEFLGRMDRQVKVRGFRIELGEIEASLCSHPDVVEAAVIKREESDEHAHLVAFISLRHDCDDDSLYAHLEAHLPHYMVPSRFVRLPELPKQPNGKLDVSAIQRLGDTGRTRSSKPLHTATEAAVAEVWKGLLGTEDVGLNDSFFRIGGHSLLATQLVLRLNRRFDLSLSIANVFDAPTLSAQARLIDQHLPAGAAVADTIDCGLAWAGADATYPRDVAVSRLFEDLAAAAPDAPAIVTDSQTVTYAEANARANQLAHHLRARFAAAPDSRGAHGSVLVGLGLKRSADALIAQLAILKAGGAYVPIDPSLPEPRIETLLQQSSTTFVLTNAPARQRFHRTGVEILDLDLDAAAIAAAPSTNLAVAPRADALAYVLFTSGTTGEPKAVGVPHRAIVRLAYGMPDVPLGAGDTVLQLAPLAFDASTFEIWCPLLRGAAIALASDDLIDTQALGAFLARHRVTTMWLTASLFNAVVDDDPRVLAGVRHLLVGGEALSLPHVGRALADVPDLKLVNGYGPTETTTFACCHPIDAAALAGVSSIPIGRPLLNTRVYVLDDQRQLVPIGHEGELWIGGDGVAIGYLNDAALTAERFARDPFVESADARIYRSGDRVRWRHDGTLEFLGRIDDQIKLRGFRIEPGEVEAAIAGCAGVQRAAVVAVDLPSIGRALAAFVVFSADLPDQERGTMIAHGLRDALRLRLPEYMVPAHWTGLDTLPLLKSGKTDRRLLASMAGSPARRPVAAAVSPASDAEARIAEICRALLGLDAIGVDDNFFDLGGHSLLATQAVSRIQSDFNVEFDLRTFFSDPTVAGLATAVGRIAAAAATAPIARVSRAAPLPLSFSQQRIWFLHHWYGENGVYNVPAALALDGDLDLDRLSAAVQAIVDRHEALRTVFPLVDGSPVQRVLDRLAISIPIVDLTHLDREAADADARALAAAESDRPFDLSTGPLIRATVVRLTPVRSVLLLTLHHIVSDGWSMQVLFRELRTLYRRAGDAHAPPLPPLPIQYADFAAWQREHLTGAVLEGHLAYWRHQLRPPVSELAWPLTKPFPEQMTTRGGRAAVRLPTETAQALSRFAAAEGVTVFMVTLAAFQSVLHRHTGQDDVLVGAPVANRNRAEIEGLIGCFINTLVMRGDLTGGPTFRQMVARTRQVAIDAQMHQDLPFEVIVDALKVRRSASRSPLFQAMLQVNDSMTAAAEFDGLSVSRFPQPFDYAKFELTLELQTVPGGVTAALSYNADLFEPAVAQGIADDFAAFLDTALAQPDVKIADIPLAGAAAARNRARLAVEPAPPVEPPPAAADERVTAIEHRLQPLWCRVLEVTAVDPNDNFFELGGHSLLAVRLFTEIEREFDVRLPLSSLFRNGTIRAQARLLSARSAQTNAWSIVVPIQPVGDRPPFFLVHGIGGEVVSFGALAESLGNQQPMFGLQAERDVDAADDRIETVAARYIDAMRAHTPRGPYYLGGYSSGGVIAYEMAQQLEAAGEPVALLAMIDASAPKAAPEPVTPHTVWRLVKNAAYWTLDDEFLRSDWASRRARVSAKLRAIRARGRHQTNRAALEAGADVRDLLGLWHVPPHARRFLERYMRMTAAYYPRRYASTVTLFRARALKLSYTGADDLGWSQLAQNVVVRYVPGAHDTILRPPRVGELAAAMSQELQQSAGMRRTSG
ncbi:MAG TPA: amino acid adenylation domain-containing protein [Vicinamibacterales bacterium]|nr:amino acid adenylation domain-containing protein [Vicinamibacterales bacterium]